MPITQKVKKYIVSKSLISEGDRILVALSGGGDSVALIHILHTLSQEMGFMLFAAHFNHRIRGEEADRDERFSGELARRLGIDFRIGSADIPSLARQKGIGLEECAREQRYSFLFETAKRLGCQRIATAHHATDNLETVLFHIVRGSGVNGIGGIAPMRADGVIRPLLCCSKSEIESFLAVNSLDFVTDSTNLDTDMTRNYIRAEILPLVKNINSSAEAAIERLSADAREDEEYFLSEAKALPDDAPLAQLACVPKPILRRYVKLRYDASKLQRAQIDHLHITEICDRITGGEKRFRLSLPGKLAALADGTRLTFVEDKPEPKPFNVSLNAPGEYSVGNGNIFLSVSREEMDKWLTENPRAITTEYAFCGNIPIFTARSRLPGDKYLRGGMHRAVRKELNAIGYPAEKRALLPNLCDGDGIFWIPGLPPRDGIKKASGSLKDNSKQLIYIGYTES
ncbi:MAG: tRNA lysidine(34) synthetase TilS [Clostridia bacterium]|nr:tRNA lysidine(34) synthetase TilS [Clostridia bacterium]